jgi:DNA-binding NarL/FixJ family response regulator
MQPTLTVREQQIVVSLAAGKTPKEIADYYGRTHHAMMAAIRYMRVRLGFRTTVQMICQLSKNTETNNMQNGVEIPRT